VRRSEEEGGGARGRSEEEGRGMDGAWWREVVELTSLIINIRHNYMQ
jgi:hypothetical protein